MQLESSCHSNRGRVCVYDVLKKFLVHERWNFQSIKYLTILFVYLVRSWSSQVNILFLCFVIFLRVVHLILVIDSPFVKGTGHINSGGIDKIINLYKENATKFDRPNWAISFIDAFIISVLSQTRKLALFPHTNCSKRLRIQRSVTHDVYPVGLLLLSSKTQFISCWQLLFSLALSFFSLSLSLVLASFFAFFLNFVGFYLHFQFKNLKRILFAFHVTLVDCAFACATEHIFSLHVSVDFVQLLNLLA